MRTEPATIHGPITEGTMVPPGDPRPVDLAAIDYVEEEYFASGLATSYRHTTPVTTDGHWDVEADESAEYTTRLVVRRPADPGDFTGTVIVEWTNVTAIEASPEWAYTSRTMVDAGAAWVGVSAQCLGVVGGEPLMQTGSEEQAAQNSGGLRGSHPERYGSLEHPGDRFSFDIFSQVGAAVRSTGAPIAGLSGVRSVVATGESQSAAFLTTYVNAVHPGAAVFDGFFIHSRRAGSAGLDGTATRRPTDSPHRLRSDTAVPVMVCQAETDVALLRSGLCRQDDTERLRTWEVAGTAHADEYLVGPDFPFCDHVINSGPQHYVVTAALESLLAWIDTGAPPPHGEPIATEDGDPPPIMRDADGLAVGGVRTPSVDVPVSVLSGAAPEGAPDLCLLFGSSSPFDDAALRDRYGSADQYVARFEVALDRAVGDGFVRSADRDSYLAEARAIEF